MRTHFLKELAIPGRERALAVLPDFDFYHLQQLLCLRWESQRGETADEAIADFTFTGLYEAGGAPGSFEVTFRCEGVTQLKLPEIHPALFVSEIEIEDLKSHGLENANFRIKSYGMTEFEVLAARLELTECTPHGYPAPTV